MCVCLVDEEVGPMLQCAACEKWFHMWCVGVKADHHPWDFICPYDCIVPTCPMCPKVPG